MLINQSCNNLFQDLLRHWNYSDFSKILKGFLYSLSEDRNHVCYSLPSEISSALHEFSKMYFSDCLCWLPLAQIHPDIHSSVWVCPPTLLGCPWSSSPQPLMLCDSLGSCRRGRHPWHSSTLSCSFPTAQGLPQPVLPVPNSAALSRAAAAQPRAASQGVLLALLERMFSKSTPRK